MSNSDFVKETQAILKSVNKKLPLAPIYEAFSKMCGVKNWNAAKALNIQFEDQIQDKLRQLISKNKTPLKLWQEAYKDYCLRPSLQNKKAYFKIITQINDIDEIVEIYTYLIDDNNEMIMLYDKNPNWIIAWKKVGMEVKERSIKQMINFDSTNIYKERCLTESELPYIWNLIEEFKRNPCIETLKELKEIDVAFNYPTLNHSLEIYRALFEVKDINLVKYFRHDDVNGYARHQAELFFYTESKETVLFIKEKDYEDLACKDVEVLEDIFYQDQLIIKKGEVAELAWVNKGGKIITHENAKSLWEAGDVLNCPFWLKSELEGHHRYAVRIPKNSKNIKPKVPTIDISSISLKPNQVRLVLRPIEEIVKDYKKMWAFNE